MQTAMNIKAKEIPRFGKRLYSIKEAAVYLGRSEWVIAHMIRTGRFPFISDGKRKLLDVQDLDKWIEGDKVIINEAGNPVPYIPQNNA